MNKETATLVLYQFANRSGKGISWLESLHVDRRRELINLLEQDNINEAATLLFDLVNDRVKDEE